ncbi:hypothetical protein PG993_001362 [Apiospora rasikravindrae]|uniref:Uncharacterized protein n=1 Tax=Apiospora rasikravindrae TaxID=990691 RepID=A0ABR1UDH2_9PEZI
MGGNGGVNNPTAPTRSPTQPPCRNDGASTYEFTGVNRQGRSSGRDAESWVEVSSHPSSSSVSSAGDEIVTTGLRVGSSAYAARRRRLHPQSYNHLYVQQQQQQQQQQQASRAVQSSQAGTSSQEEYEESETDSDPVITSSTENITSVHIPGSTPLRNVYHAAPETSDEEEDDDDHATALGTRRPSEPFRPQPNAFSHPPSHLQHRHSTSSSIPQNHPRPSFSQRSSTARVDRRAPNLMSPSYQADNDAALRASLTTLLSCAAAARGREKDGDKESGERTDPAGTQPMNLRFVPESELMPPTHRPVAQGRVLRADPAPAPSGSSKEATPGSEKVKRAATPTPPSKQPRAVKKKKTTSSNVEEALISPTLLTWVVSAGVVVLVSVVGFGAGYVIGREVGRQETLSNLGVGNASAAVSEGGSCGREVIRSSGGTLRRFRWGSVVGKGVTA